ncbi:conserved Plasmodium protein, unknown function [Plasmodium relictum]|uniref:Uncharacterized protein n=1 Tax=Plasmodium relictum TaxID=85471 RepID=A0A1J1HB89_PLARL|nr:conserved Plasmodium protein, unknown function [Plasmodium relictum]CRH00698.1 conserved Plasmodium protein, unknown function [Plasmodium relictum]
MNTINEFDNINENNNNEKGDYIIKSTTFANNEKMFECHSKIAPVDKINVNNENIEIFINSNNITSHINSVMGYVNNLFTKKINEKKGK